MSEIAEEVEATEVVEETPTIVDRMEERLSQVGEKEEIAVEEEVVEPEETTEAEEVVEEKPTGPSPAMKAVARQQGVEEYVVRLARSDEELEEVITQRAEERVKQEALVKPEPLPEFKLSLPEDEFPDDDPVRKCLSEMNEHYQEQISFLEQAALELFKNVGDISQEHHASKKVSESQWFSQFDGGLDELDSEALGQSSQRSDEMNDMRSAVFSTARRLQSTNPDASPKELAQLAARKLGLAKATMATKEAVRAGNSRVSAVTPAKTVKTPLSGTNKIQGYLDRLGNSPERRNFFERRNGA